MICPSCGCEQAGPAQFCRQCGQRIDGPAIPPYAAYWQERARMRVSNNLQPLAIAWFVFGAMRMLTGLTGMFWLHAVSRSGMWSFGDVPPFVPHLLSSLIPFIAVTSVTMGLLSILVGWALQTRQSWGRTLAIVVGILELLKIPFGTALGVYTLWVLAPSASGDEWRRIQVQQV